MRIISCLCIFYQKLIIPSVAISIVVSFFTMELVDFYERVKCC
jgi:hypothetical protein